MYVLLPATLIARSRWFLLPAVLLALAMVHSMMECVASLLVQPSRRAHASSRAALFARLLALNSQRPSYHVEPGHHVDLVITFDPIDPAWRARFAQVKLSTGYRARIVLDEERRELRWFEVVWARSRFVGFTGLWPRFAWGAWIFAGYIDVRWTGWAYGMRSGFPPRIEDAIPFSLDTTELKHEVRTICARGGWTFRPKIWAFQVRRRSDGTLPRGLIPSVTRFWSERQFWTTLYPALYVATLLYLAVAIGGWSELVRRNTLLPLLGFTAFWWLVSGSIIGIFYVAGRRR